MSRIVFWDVDTQADFFRPDGKLAVPGAEGIVSNLEALTRQARKIGHRVIASACDHRLEDPVIALKNPDRETSFPPHCLHGTPGEERIAATRPASPLVFNHRDPPTDSLADLAELIRAHEGELVLTKGEPDVFSNPHADRVVEALDPEGIVLYGVACEHAVRFAVEGLLARGRNIVIVTDAVAAFDGDRASGLIAKWRRLGAGIATTDGIAGSARGLLN